MNIDTLVVCGQLWGVKTNLHVSLRRHERDLDESGKGRVLIGRGVKDGGNRIIKWCVLIGSPYTCPKIGSHCTYQQDEWRRQVLEGFWQNGG